MSDDLEAELEARRQRQVVYRAQLLEFRRQRRFRSFFERCKSNLVNFVERPLWSVWIRLWRVTLGPRLFVKSVRIHEQAQNEVAAMRLVTSKTTIPTPRPLGCFRWRSRSYIVMTRAPGVVLDTVCMSLSEEDKSTIIAQLAGFVAQLRTLRSPFGQRICSTRGTRLPDIRLGWEGGGPFENESDFNLQLREGVELESMPENIIRSHSITHAIHFTHGDLFPRNIMVEGTRITSVFDWGETGWFPAHWEHRKATLPFSIDSVSEDWRAYVPKFAPEFKMEIETDDFIMKEGYWSLF